VRWRRRKQGWEETTEIRGVETSETRGVERYDGNEGCKGTSETWGPKYVMEIKGVETSETRGVTH